MQKSDYGKYSFPGANGETLLIPLTPLTPLTVAVTDEPVGSEPFPITIVSSSLIKKNIYIIIT